MKIAILPQRYLPLATILILTTCAFPNQLLGRGMCNVKTFYVDKIKDKGIQQPCIEVLKPCDGA